MIKIQAIQDEDSHWYLVPNNEVNEFNGLLSKMYSSEIDGGENSINEFEIKFSKYRIGGINNKQLYIE